MPKRKVPASSTSSQSLLSFFRSASAQAENPLEPGSRSSVNRSLSLKLTKPTTSKALGSSADNALIIDDSSGDEETAFEAELSSKSSKKARVSSNTSIQLVEPLVALPPSIAPTSSISSTSNIQNSSMVIDISDDEEWGLPNDETPTPDLKSPQDESNTFGDGELFEEEQDVLDGLNTGLDELDLMSCPVCSMVFDEDDGVSHPEISSKD